MAPDRLQAVCQPTRIRGNPSARFFATQNRVISANVSFRRFAASDRVISPVYIWAELPFDVLSILPARFRVIIARSRVIPYAAPARFRVITARSRVKPYAAHLWVTMYDTHLRVPAHLWVNLFATVKLYDTRLRVPARLWANLFATRLQVKLYAAHLQVPAPLNLYVYAACSEVNLYVAPLQVNLYATYSRVNPYAVYLQGNQYTTHLLVNMYGIFKWVNQCASCEWEEQYAPQWVNNNQNILPAYFGVYSLPQFGGSNGSVWRDSTAQYNVADHPFFVFHPKLVNVSNFGETFNMYAHHLLQYRLVCVIKFVLQWSNHWCHFISKHACMLVNFDLTPQQHCRRAHFTVCRSQYYKHDFAIISSVYDHSTNYAVVGFVKYFENSIQWILQHKYIYKRSVRYKVKDKIQINNSFGFQEHNVSSKIGGGQHLEKIEMKVINPFIIDGPLNVSDIEMCEFVDHLEMSKCLKNYKNSDHLLCNVPLHYLMTYLFKNNRISIGSKHGIHISRKMTKHEITKLFKMHDDICKHEYVTVFRPHKQISSSE